MERKIILKNTESGQELTLPVTPSSYPMEAGRGVERLDMAQTGQIALPGLKSLFSETLEAMLPARLYPFCTDGAVANPSYYLELLTAWSEAGDVCRYIVAGAGVNRPVLLGPVAWTEDDGTNDVTVKLPLYEYRYLEEVQVEQTGNSTRPVETASQPKTAERYTVEAGDSLWAICRKAYGDGSLAYRLATANGIKNPNLIYPGQVLTLPDLATLSAYEETRAAASGGSASSGSSGSTVTLPTAEEQRQEQLAERRAETQRTRVLLGLKEQDELRPWEKPADLQIGVRQ